MLRIAVALILFVVPLVTSCQETPPKPAQIQPVWQELEVKTLSVIQPDGVNIDDWTTYARYVRRVKAPQIFVPNNATAGSRIPITIFIDPSYSMDLKMMYDEPSSGTFSPYNQKYELLSPDDQGKIVVNWFAPSDLQPVSKNHAVVSLFLDVYPPQRAYYSQNWRTMLAVEFSCSFTVETKR